MAANLRSDWTLDDRIMRCVFAGIATIVGIFTIAARGNPAVDLSLIGFTVIVFWLWALVKWFPLWALYLVGMTTAPVLNIIESKGEISMFLPIIAIAIASSMELNRLVPKLLTLLAVVVTVGMQVFRLADDFGWQNWIFGILFSWGFGEIVFRYAGVIEELEHARSLVADRAAVEERRRIARDVHDLVGHSLSVVMLHVTGARHILRKDPDEAERALIQAEAAGRSSLAEIRRTVGLLYDTNDGTPAALPFPDLSDIDSLVEGFSSAGLRMSLEVSGPIEKVVGSSALAGYRIVQEALTNVSRHTNGAKVEVVLTVGEETYEVSVTNSGGMAKDSKGSGFGLVSMSERAKSVSGSLIVGPTQNGWNVEATLPISTHTQAS